MNRRTLTIGLIALAAPTLALAGTYAASVLDIPLRAQEQNNWCWAATTEMTMEAYGDAVEQCELANSYFDRTDCCDTPDAAACNRGGHPPYLPGEEFGDFNYTADIVYGQMSFEAIKSQIDDVSRPMNFRWKWSGGDNAHWLVLAGYAEPTGEGGETYVIIDDPWPPNEGRNRKWVTYTEWTGNAAAAYDAHTLTHTIYNIAPGASTGGQ